MTREQVEKLFQQYLDDSISQEDYIQFRAWAADTANQAAFDELLAAALQQLPVDVAADIDLNTIYGELLAKKAMHGLTDRVRPLRRSWWAAAAVLFILLGTGAYFWLQRSPKMEVAAAQNLVNDVTSGTHKAILTLANGATITLDSAGNRVIRQGSTAINQHNGQLLYTASNTTTVSYNILTTPPGGQFRITLPDGSKVWLNSASSLRYPIAFNGKERIVELQGQGYFEIATNADQPFKVKVQHLEVQVLGTRFDIMAYADEKTVNTTLLDGAVKIKQGAVQAILSPGQQAVLDHTVNALSVQPVDVNQVIAWKTGFFEFANTDLATIMRQIARWYDVEVVYQDTHSKERFLGRISRDQPLSHILRLLEENGVRFKIEGKKVIVLR